MNYTKLNSSRVKLTQSVYIKTREFYCSELMQKAILFNKN